MIDSQPPQKQPALKNCLGSCDQRRFACRLSTRQALPAGFGCLRTAFSKFKHLITTTLFLTLALTSLPSHALDIKLVGVEKKLRPTMRATIEAPTDDSEEGIAEFLDAIPDRVQQTMQSVGYYNAKVDVQREGEVATVTVDAGEPVKINLVVPIINGMAREDGGYMPVIGQMPLKKNAIFTHADYEKAKDVLFDRAQDRGYFDFEYVKTEVRISRKNNTAEIRLEVDSGERYSFATVEFDSDYFSDEVLQTYVPFEYGDDYESSKLALLTQQMQNTGFFSTVKVVPLRGELYGKQVPIKIEVRKKEKNQVGIGLGFATDTEWRGKLTWTKPLVNKAGHSFDAALGVSAINQDLTFAYRIPRASDPLSNYWSLEAGIQNVKVEEQVSFLSTVNMQRIRRTPRNWTESFFVRWEREKFELPGQEDEVNLVLPGFSYAKNKSTGFPFPTEGYSVFASFFLGSKQTLSDILLYKSVVNLKYLKSVSKNDTFILSAQYGAINSSDFDRVPTSQRFFVGGDRTIRGFPFRTLSPLNADGEAVGGRYLEVTSLEYNRKIRDVWALALFVDAGRAFDSFKSGYNVGAGFGVRWYSPVGPFRIDFAFGISDEDTPFQLHLSLGPDL